jgi:hypothetical protein
MKAIHDHSTSTTEDIQKKINTTRKIRENTNHTRQTDEQMRSKV